MKPNISNLTVAGLWHLGCVTAACCARHFRVTAYDPDPDRVRRLQEGKAPIFEPGLEELLQAGQQAGRLRVTSDPAEACQGSPLLWCTWDTPVNDADASDVEAVLQPLGQCLEHLPDAALVLVSSQLPVGSCRGLEARFPRLQFAASPENLRLGRAIESFEHPERVVVGTRNDQPRPLLETLLRPFTDQILWMQTESAEMVKHALNSFLALSISFINEVATLCEATGADAAEVAAGLKSDPRIGPRAYLKPGGSFAGGTLARDVVSLTRLGEERRRPLHLIPAIKQSNDRHRAWCWDRLQEKLGTLKDRRVAVLGLTYKPQTDTLRRSAAVELIRQLLEAGASVRACDPVVGDLGEVLPAEVLAGSPGDALRGADAAVVATEWPQWHEADWPSLIPLMRRPLVLDPNGFLEKDLPQVPSVEHLRVGRKS